MKHQRSHGALPRGRWLTANVVAIGMVSLLTDAASEMVIPLLPLFVTTVLHGGAIAVGLIEGVAEATAAILKLVSGWWADRVGRNKPFVLAGYGLSSLARPFVAAATAPMHVLVVRMIDRVGKGLRSSPRDAILAGSVPAEHRAQAFGFHRAMDHAGAVIGPLIAVAVLTWWTRDLRTLFWLTAIPGALAVVAVLLIRDTARAPVVAPADSAPDAAPDAAKAVAEERVDTRRLVRFLVPLGLFTLGNASDVFLLLKANAERAPITSLPLLWMGLHLVKTVASVPGGWLADRIGHRRVIAAGWIFYAVIYAALAYAESTTTVAILFVVYGLYHGLVEGAEKALVAEATGARKRGTAFGWYHLVQGLLALAASLLFGILWEVVSPKTAFLTGAALALAATVALIALAPPAPATR